MSIRRKKPTSSGLRHRFDLDFSTSISKIKPERSLIRGLVKKTGGRNSTGKITMRHKGGGHKRMFREVDFKRNKHDIPAKVMAVEYDPNRRANLALLYYADGEKRYILSPHGLQIGEQIITGENSEIKIGNALPLAKIPIGTQIHNIEIKQGKGGQLVRTAGTAAVIQAQEKDYTTIQLPSKEQRLIHSACYATVGQVGNEEWKTIKLGKAGRKRHLGIRPSVRGVAMHPAAHPHGGGEGRSGIGMPSPKSPWGKPTLGKRTRKKVRYSNKFIVKHRKAK